MSTLLETLNFSVKEVATNAVRYLSVTGPQRLLRCGAGDGVFSPTATFALEPAGNGLVHIRSCYDNHYWARESKAVEWLSASAPEPVADKSVDGCTLFRPQMGDLWVGFVHVQSGLNVVTRPASDPFSYNLGVDKSAPTEFSYIDHASFVKLPRYVMFKANNGKYLAAHDEKAQYFDGESKTHPSVGYETFVTRSGGVRIKSRLLGTFWNCHIHPQYRGGLKVDYPADSDPSNPATIFRPDTYKISQVLFRCPGDKISSIEGNSELLTTPDHSQSAAFTILSLANQSHVTVTEFKNHRFLNKNSQECPASTPIVLENRSDEAVREGILIDQQPIEYTFTNSVTHGQGSANFTTPIPYITEQGQVVIPSEVVSLSQKDWGQTYRDNTFAKLHHVTIPHVTVPAKSRVTATLLAKTATCAIPFSYEIKEEFYTGGGDTYSLHDGVFTGTYTYAYEVRIDKTEPY